MTGIPLIFVLLENVLAVHDLTGNNTKGLAGRPLISVSLNDVTVIHITGNTTKGLTGIPLISVLLKDVTAVSDLTGDTTKGLTGILFYLYS